MCKREFFQITVLEENAKEQIIPIEKKVQAMPEEYFDENCDDFINDADENCYVYAFPFFESHASGAEHQTIQNN